MLIFPNFLFQESIFGLVFKIQLLFRQSNIKNKDNQANRRQGFQTFPHNQKIRNI